MHFLVVYLSYFQPVCPFCKLSHFSPLESSSITSQGRQAVEIFLACGAGTARKLALSNVDLSRKKNENAMKKVEAGIMCPTKRRPLAMFNALLSFAHVSQVRVDVIAACSGLPSSMQREDLQALCSALYAFKSFAVSELASAWPSCGEALLKLPLQNYSCLDSFCLQQTTKQTRPSSQRSVANSAAACKVPAVLLVFNLQSGLK